MLLLGAAGAAGLAVCLIVVLVAWNDMSLWVLSPEQYATRHGLLVLGRAIYVYGVDNKTLPASLEDLRGTEYGRDLVFGEKGGPLDGWGRPFVYARDDGNCSVTSFGRDGLPGGVGMDSDMTDASPFPTYIRPTLMEFVKYCPEGMLGAAVLSGGLTFLLIVYLVSPGELRRRRLLSVALMVGASAIGAGIVGVVLAHLHLPVGH